MSTTQDTFLPPVINPETIVDKTIDKATYTVALIGKKTEKAWFMAQIDNSKSYFSAVLLKRPGLEIKFNLVDTFFTREHDAVIFLEDSQGVIYDKELQDVARRKDCSPPCVIASQHKKGMGYFPPLEIFPYLVYCLHSMHLLPSSEFSFETY